MMEQVFILRKIVEQVSVWQGMVHLNIIHFEKAFDYPPWKQVRDHEEVWNPREDCEDGESTVDFQSTVEDQ